MTRWRAFGMSTSLVISALGCSPSSEGPKCAHDVDCLGGLVCSNGSCQPAVPQCAANSDCPAGSFCAVGICQQLRFNLRVQLLGNGKGRVTSNPPGIDCPGTCAADFRGETSVILKSTVNPSSDFMGWSGDCSGTGACIVKIDGNKQVRASHKEVRMLFMSARNLNGTDGAPSTSSNIWAVNIDGSGLAPVTTTIATTIGMPQWSPDGTRVLFVSDRSVDGSDVPTNDVNLWRVNADGTGSMPLTKSMGNGVPAAGRSEPQWSPDGTQIAFESALNLDGTDSAIPSGATNIWRVKADGTSLMPLTTDVALGVNNGFPQWSIDGAQIVFLSPRKADGTLISTSILNVWRIRPDGTGLASLGPVSPPRGPRDFGTREYQWSPDGTQVVFLGPNEQGFFDLFRMKADGSGLTALTSAATGNVGSANPQWSPDGTQIVFSSSVFTNDTLIPFGTGNIWRVNPDGTGLAPLTKATAFTADSGNPRWSPDGSEIVFESRRDTSGVDAASAVVNIWKIKPDGTGLMPLTKATATGADSSNPLWSPDGKRIAFDSRKNADGTDTANPNLTSNVWTVRVDGSGLIPLGVASAADAYSSGAIWSPGSTRVIFGSRANIDGSNSVNPNGIANIWRANADGSGLAPITRSTAPSTNCSFPECLPVQLRP